MNHYPPMPTAGEENREDHEGYTPLHSAVMAGQRKRAIQLAAAGANPYHKNRQGLSPIRMARNMGWVLCAELMEEAYEAWTETVRSATLAEQPGANDAHEPHHPSAG